MGRAAPLLRLATWALCLAPMAHSLQRGLGGSLGRRSHMTAELGTVGLRLLILVLALPLIVRLLRRPQLMALRPILGLSAFFYALAHVGFVLELSGAWRFPLEALRQRPDFVPGLVALLVLAPAAAISVPPLRNRVPPEPARRLRAWTLWAAPLTLIHYLMPVWQEQTTPYLYMVLVAALLAWRRRKPSASAGKGD